MSTFVVAALYKFTPFEDPAVLRAPIREVCDANGIRGTLLLAREGINGTIAGSRDGIDAALGYLRGLPGCADLEVKESFAPEMPFARMKVRLKKEIVTLGQSQVDPNRDVGTYVEPDAWNRLVQSNDVVLIDTRNDYETAIGTFPGAVDPGTRTFREFPKWWEENRSRFEGRPVAMFCTGGIRCEKATSYLKSEGVEEVYHLKGGILKYLETVPREESLWNGECYVFDGRVSVGHGLEPGPYEMCHACGRPISEPDKADPAFEEGVSCAACLEEYTDADRARFRERQRQHELSLARGDRNRDPATG
ncbi:rhodanese-related sulfurtransferase [Amaricoccus macauensis]|uniref:oxygen-dependent tRNA uridine(34) hydroxylase TrhO n=1 Tax=Amaricoccus macauensis TaxID=57001 RepID=UPI003C7998B7